MTKATEKFENLGAVLASEPHINYLLLCALTERSSADPGGNT